MLNASPSKLSKEPRPVYAAELDVLGFDRYWQYELQLDAPYLWAEANAYYYRGVLVAKLRGGDVYTAPEIDLMKDEEGTPLLPKSTVLHPVDIGRMVEKNRELLGIVEQTTAKKIVAVYEKYQKKLDCFHVAFSGGKDSCVLLDLVKKALPQGSFVVVFGDTGMEFPDTYALVDAVEADCKREGIPFYRAKSHFTPQESWKLFGPPSRTLRWCCSVHKSTPQVLKLREITGKTDYRGLAFVGVRADESARRAKYKEFNNGKKIKGQYSHNSILEWSSAEIWLYIYTHQLLINEAYKKGNSRAGCIFCPMSILKAGFIKKKIYPHEVQSYIDIIINSSGRNYGKKSYISKGGWVSRRSGRDLIGNKMSYSERILNGNLIITVKNPRTDWKEWIQTLEEFDPIPYKIQTFSNGYIVSLPELYIKKNPVVGKLFKQVFRKAAYCVSCGTCQSNCVYGCLSLQNGVHIQDCKHCLQCHDIENGCHTYASLKIPIEEKSMSVNSFDSVLPKVEWFSRYFEMEDDFWNNTGLGPNQIKIFKRFLKDSGITKKNFIMPFGKLLKYLGIDTGVSWGLILINLANDNPQINWYVKNLDMNEKYSREQVLLMLDKFSRSQTANKFVYRAFNKLAQLPLGTVLNFGHVTEKGELVRTKCVLSDPRVLLYGLFKFAEKCGDYKGFTLSTLLNDTIDRDGISPTRIFGLTREEAKPMLRGLSARYPKFIDAAFTHDLEKITLSADKSSADVLTLFEGEEA